MIEFEKAKLVENRQVGKDGRQIDKITVNAQVTEKIAKEFGEGVRWSLYDRNGVIRPGFSKTDLTFAFADANFHLSVTGVKGAEIQLEGVLVHRFRIAVRGDGDKKPKILVCAFEVLHTKTATGPSSPMLQEFLRKFIGGKGVCRLKYPEQEAMFTEKPEAAPILGLHTYSGGKFTAELHAVEHTEGYAATRKAAGAGKKLVQKPPVVSASEAEALALAAYEVCTWADKIAAGAKGAAKKDALALAEWAAGFAGTPDVAGAVVTITKHTN